jgi:LacI family transcriptional regulator
MNGWGLSIQEMPQGGKKVIQRRPGHVTLLDIARACGCSVSTVSIVLSEAPLSKNVAKNTREHILQVARQLGYHPDAYARSLRRRHSQTIAVLAYDLSDPFCIPLVQGVQSGLQTANYLPLLMDAQAQRKRFDSYLKMIIERRAEAVIVIASWLFEETNLLADIEKNSVPIVIVGRDLTANRVNSMLIDNERGGALAFSHLAKLGHRKIAVIRGPEELLDSEPRWKGVQRAAGQAKIRIDPRLVLQLPNLRDSAFGFEGGLKAASQLLSLDLPFSAVLAFDDLTALGVMRGLAAAGLSVPEQCSVIGFDDLLPAMVATPGVTTVHQPLKEMGLLASEWVLEEIQTRQIGKEDQVRLHHALPELVIRGSTGRVVRHRRRQTSV